MISLHSYLTENNLCGRAPVQSIIDTSQNQVKKICSDGGKRVESGGNLCISTSDMTVHEVTSEYVNEECTVTRLRHRQQKVVVACDKVGNVCRPVHYQAYRNQQPTEQDCS